MRPVTLCFLKNGENICIAMKKRGFGEGKWNSVGGKVDEGEIIEEAAVRELEEEIGVRSHTDHLEKVGDIKFYFNGKPEWNQRMHIYFVHSWESEPEESEEMLPKWHHKDKLPYKDMWVDDSHWLPKVLEGKKIQATFYFNNDGAEIDKFDIKEI